MSQLTAEFIKKMVFDNTGRWTRGEKALVKWKFNYLSTEFSKRLFDLIEEADALQKQRIRKIYSSQVDAYISWMTGDLKERLEKENDKFMIDL